MKPKQGVLFSRHSIQLQSQGRRFSSYKLLQFSAGCSLRSGDAGYRPIYSKGSKTISSGCPASISDPTRRVYLVTAAGFNQPVVTMATFQR